MTVRLAYLSLALAPGIGPARMRSLLDRFGTAEAVLRAPFAALRSVPGMSAAAATAVRKVECEDGARVLRRLEALGGHLLVPGDRAFPSQLETIPVPPVVLFALGDVALLQRPAAAIVGSRDHTRYGREVCRHIAGRVAGAGVVVASGMARGLDAVAHEAALDADGPTVGVLGNGIGVVYPSANRVLYERMAAQGCLVTEFPPGERPTAGSFPRRNRLISGLARVTVVIEAGERSGTLLTVDAALAQGRDVLAVPGPITSPRSVGCNRLIAQGATPVLGVRDVLEAFGIDAGRAGAAAVRLAPVERDVLGAVERGAETTDQIAERLDVPVTTVLAAVTDLELKGIVQVEPGNVVRRALSQAVDPVA